MHEEEQRCAVCVCVCVDRVSCCSPSLMHRSFTHSRRRRRCFSVLCRCCPVEAEICLESSTLDGWLGPSAPHPLLLSGRRHISRPGRFCSPGDAYSSQRGFEFSGWMDPSYSQESGCSRTQVVARVCLAGWRLRVTTVSTNQSILQAFFGRQMCVRVCVVVGRAQGFEADDTLAVRLNDSPCCRRRVSREHLCSPPTHAHDHSLPPCPPLAW